MRIVKRFPLFVSFTTLLLTGCVVPPSLSSSGNPSIDVTSVASNSSEVITTSVSETSLDLAAYFEVVSTQKLFNENPKLATIQVRLTGQSLTKQLILQGVQLIANDFYESNLIDIQDQRVNLTIQLFNSLQTLNTTPTYGDVLFVINETNLLIGIQLKEDRIVTA
jgi:hypothetical protein